LQYLYFVACHEKYPFFKKNIPISRKDCFGDRFFNWLSKRARTKEFEALSDSEIEVIENKYMSIFLE